MSLQFHRDGPRGSGASAIDAALLFTSGCRGDCSTIMKGDLLLDLGLVDEHDWDVVTNWIDAFTLDTLQPAFVGFQFNLGFACRAREDF